MRRTVLAWLTTSVVAAGATSILAASTTGCQTACESHLDCGLGGAYCEDQACKSDCSADSDCPKITCEDGAPGCIASYGRCSDFGRCEADSSILPGRRGVQLPDVIAGKDAPPSSGPTFVVDSLAIADEAQGFDIDGAGSRVDNALAPLGRLANSQIQLGVTGGDSLLIIELAGLEPTFLGSSGAFATKLYMARDADVSPGNNFAPSSAGDPRCCEFDLRSASLAGDPRRAISWVPTRIQGGKLTTLTPASLTFTLTIGPPPHPDLNLRRAYISAQVPADMQALSSGLLGGAATARSLAAVPNPYCQTLSELCPRSLPRSTLLDLVSGFFQPDIDLNVPKDGLDRLIAGPSGVIDECRGGSGGVPIMPTRPGDSCTTSPELTDGYSVALRFSAVPAVIRGERP
jgi:hypothetical protein